MWLIKEEIAVELERVRKGFEPTAEQLASFMAATEASHDESGIMSVAGNVAEIRVTGVLTDAPSFAAWLFGGGGTLYGEIREALATADADPKIKRAELFIDSGGGQVSGLFETLDSIKAFSKPMSVRAACACSAAYAIAAATGGKIEATGDAAEFGSIGVAITYFQWADEEVIDITSTEAPDKRPDVTTEEGKAVVRRELDAIHELFVEAIAEGRGIKPKQVNADFGRGAVLLARDAKAAGLVDKIPKRVARRGAVAEVTTIEPEASATVQTTSETPALPEIERGESNPETSAPRPAVVNQRKTLMNQTELKAQHPDLYAAVFAAGRKEGAETGAADALTAERDRVGAHLEMLDETGDSKTALAAIASGEGMTMTLSAKYVRFGMNRANQEQRETESTETKSVTDDAQTGDTPEKDEGDLVADAMDRITGKKVA